MEKEFDIIVDESVVNERLDILLTQKTGITRAQISKMIENGCVKVNSKIAKSSYRLKFDDRIFLAIPEAVPLEAKPQQIPLDIVYEDKDIIAINKPRGIVVHPAVGHADGTLVNAILYHCKDLSGVGGVIRPGVVHRLDQDTSGILLFAKNDEAHLELSRQLKEREVKKTYIALVYGEVKKESDLIDLPIGRHPNSRTKMAVIKTDRFMSRDAITGYKVLKRFKGYTLLELDLQTGRTHQIRVHLAHIGHPVVGDEFYSRKRSELSKHGQLLHAHKIVFNHPITGKTMELIAKIPEDIEKAIAQISISKE